MGTENITQWTDGGVEVTTDDLIIRTLKPEMDGLFCRKITGLLKIGNAIVVSIKELDIEALFVRDVIENNEKVELEHRMGYIKLAARFPRIFGT